MRIFLVRARPKHCFAYSLLLHFNIPAFLVQYHMVFADSQRVPSNANLSSVDNFYLISKRNVSDVGFTMGFLGTVSGDF